MKEPISCCCWRRPNLYIGVKTGGIVSLELTPTGTAALRQLPPLKHGVTRIALGENGSLVGTDEKGKLSVITEGDTIVPIMGHLTNAVMCSGTLILGRVKGEKWLRVVAIVGELRILPAAALIRSPILRTLRASKLSLREEPRLPWTCVRFGYPLLAQLLEVSNGGNPLRQEVSVLQSLCQELGSLRERALRFALILGDFESAKAILLSTDANDPQFMMAMLMVALIGHTDGNEERTLATTGLISHGHFELAIDLFLLTGHWELAVRKLMEFDRWFEAELICRIRPPSEMRNALLEEIAAHMIEDGMARNALLIRAELGQGDWLAAKFRQLDDREQADFIGSISMKSIPM
jgi:hypothetical protein